MLLRQTGRESKDIPPNLSAPLLRAVLTGCRYPESLLGAVIRRIRADREINYLRASIVKGCLIRNHGKEIPMSLDIEKPEPAYRLGRLFAALEKAQEDALGSVNASIRDRFYSSASATPGTVFPRLLRTYQHHLGKLEGGLKIAREKLVQEILDPLKGFPAHMGLADQGLFALGYYQQRQAFFRKKTVDVDQP
jgi:CRISPR-associated protein Csd1